MPQQLIALADCEDRRLYEIRSRNLTVGAFRARTGGFLGIREKFGARYVFEEYHYERDQRLGTAYPVVALSATVPDDIPMTEYLDGPNGERLRCVLCGHWAVQYRGNSHPDQPPGPPFYRHSDEPDGQDVCRADGETYGRAVPVANTALHEFLIAHTDWARDPVPQVPDAR